MKKLSLLALSILAVSAFAACNESETNTGCKTSNCIITTPGQNPGTSTGKIDVDFSTKKLALTKANTCDDYKKHILDSLAMKIANERFQQRHYCWYGGVDMIQEESDDSFNDAKESSGAAASPTAPSAGEYTETNTQEAGVDELDTVKNDGNYMYTIRGGQIHISKIWPVTEMKEVATIERDELKNDENRHSWFSPHGIFLTADKRLIDIGETHTWHRSDNKYWYGNYNNVISIRIFDVSNPEKPKLIKTHQLDGEFTDARLINNRLHLVSSATPSFTWYDVEELSRKDIPGVPRFEVPCYDENFDEESWTEEGWEQWKQKQNEWLKKGKENTKTYLPVIRAWLEKEYPTINDFKWPNYFDGTTAKAAVACSELYIPAMTSKQEGFLLVSEFSGKDYENFKASAITDSGWLVYASQKNLYVSSFSYNWWWDNGCYDNDIIIDGAEVPEFDEAIPDDPVYAPMGSCANYTQIHHFSLGEGAGETRYVNSGELEGIANNSFYYSEYDNHLRVFSSPEEWGNSATGHKLSVFDINTPTTMTQTGVVQGFGKDEQIKSARMFGDKGYVVTFRQTDPLFVFDLSDHKNPRQVGELKINGYSSYIHPVGKNHLLTIGQDATDQGRVTGMQLQLFDVSNPADPKLKYKTKINEEKWDDNSGSYGWSEALNNHHAFQYHEGSGLLAIPVNIESWSYKNNYYDWKYKFFSGMFVYRVTPTSDFEFLGGVNHVDIDPNKKDKYYSWWTTVDRSRFYFKTAGEYKKDAYIYTISRNGLKASNALKPDETFGTIQYDPEEYADDFWY